MDHDRLPPEATDTGDRIVIAPSRSTRIWAIGGALLAIALGAALLVLGEGLIMRLGGVASALAGVYLLIVQAQRLEFDQAAVRRRSWLRPRSMAWSEIGEAKIARRYESAHAAGSARRLGGLTISMGLGGGRRRRGVRRDQPFVVVSVHGRDDDSDLTIELNDADVTQGEALLEVLDDRGWLPEDVKVTVDAGR